MAAAIQGANLLSAEDLPTLWKAEAELEQVPTGVNPSPCAFQWPNAWYARSPEAWMARKTTPIPGVVAYRPETRTILGVRVDLPLKAIDYPLSLEERSQAPWLWQVQRAVAILEQHAHKIFAQADRYPEMAEVALSWRTEDFYERKVRLSSIVNGARNAGWIEAMMRLALLDGDGAADVYVYAVHGRHLQDLVHAAQVVILQQTKDKKIAAGVADRVAEMSRELDSLPREAQPRPTAISILEIARWAADQGLEMSTRYSFAAQVCKAVGDPTCQSALRSDGPSSDKAPSLAKFEVWFARARIVLDERAAAEKPKLVQLAAELHQRL